MPLVPSCRICGSADLIETAKDWRNRPRMLCQNCGGETIQRTLDGDCWRCNGEGVVYTNPGWPDPQTETEEPCPQCGGRCTEVPAPSPPATQRGHQIRRCVQSALVVFLTLLAPTAASALTYSDTLAREVERLSGKPATVWCSSSFGEWGALPQVAAFRRAGLDPQGLTDSSIGVVLLDPGVCYGLLDATDPLNAGTAALVLAHEAMHVRYPAASEALTECRAYQRVRRVIAWLRLPDPASAMREARAVHRNLRSVPGYDWKGLC